MKRWEANVRLSDVVSLERRDERQLTMTAVPSGELLVRRLYDSSLDASA
jgi:hypothetical protein